MANTNINRFKVVGTDIVEVLTGKIVYNSNPDNLEIKFHCDVLNGLVTPEWINDEHLMWSYRKNKVYPDDEEEIIR